MTETSGRRRTTARKKEPNAEGLFTFGRYSRELAKNICDRLAKGEKWSHFANTEGYPAYPTLYMWRRRHPEFAEAYEIAKQVAADRKAEKALDVAEAAPSSPQADRLLVSTLMQHAALDAPTRWGGKAPPAASAPERPQRIEVVFRVRHFEKVIGPDGKAYTREVKPEGQT